MIVPRDAVTLSLDRRYNEIHDFIDEEKYDEAIAKAEALLGESELHRYHRIKCYLVLAAVVDDWGQGAELLETAETLWGMARRTIPVGNADEQAEAGLHELREAIDATRKNHEEDRPADGEDVDMSLAEYEEARWENATDGDGDEEVEDADQVDEEDIEVDASMAGMATEKGAGEGAGSGGIADYKHGLQEQVDQHQYQDKGREEGDGEMTTAPPMRNVSRLATCYDARHAAGTAQAGATHRQSRETQEPPLASLLAPLKPCSSSLPSSFPATYLPFRRRQHKPKPEPST
ncbi:hypothetical protein LTR53_000555 [Teratosphaeriaceae sp. CCFEE 6253]|nr:hypothetical protein LTR53_000555 [Teratosphaeriaceae sp. CCFEE 6253]